LSWYLVYQNKLQMFFYMKYFYLYFIVKWNNLDKLDRHFFSEPRSSNEIFGNNIFIIKLWHKSCKEFYSIKTEIISLFLYCSFMLWKRKVIINKLL